MSRTQNRKYQNSERMFFAHVVTTKLVSRQTPHLSIHLLGKFLRDQFKVTLLRRKRKMPSCQQDSYPRPRVRGQSGWPSNHYHQCDPMYGKRSPSIMAYLPPVRFSRKKTSIHVLEYFIIIKTIFDFWRDPNFRWNGRRKQIIPSKG